MTSPLDVAVGMIRTGDLGHVEALRAQVLAFCDANPNALLRANEQAHLTASALVVDLAEGRFVLLLHRKLRRWLQPGGHADGNGDLAAVALQEAREETGLDDLAVRPGAIDLDVHDVAPPGEPAHRHLDLRFLVYAPPGSAATGPPPGNDESLTIAWVREAELERYEPDASTRRLVQRGLEVAASRADQLGRPRDT